MYKASYKCEWVRTWGGDGYEYASGCEFGAYSDLIIDDVDNVYVLGGTNSSSGDYDIVLAKNIVIAAPSSEGITGYNTILILAIIGIGLILIWRKHKK
ncbi:MAG: hypothetical protein ACFFCI_10965 [Promethearchaeota archaeon]